MNLMVYGGAERLRLVGIARNIYSLSDEEFVVSESPDVAGEFQLEISTTRHIEPIIRFTVSPDFITGTVSLYPGINSDKVYSVDEMVELLKERFKVEPIYVKKDALGKILQPFNSKLAVEDTVVASSPAVEHGRNAVVQVFFEAPSKRPKILPNGKVDYKDFSEYIMVKEGDLLIRRTPPTLGNKGYDVTGAELLPKPGKDITVVAIDGITVDEEQKEFKAKFSGHVVYTGSAISVLPLLNISGNLDFHSGNITFDGAVNISKDALAGFSVTADDVIIKGIDEDAIINAKNTVTIETGVKGLGGKGGIKAGTNVYCGYAENTNIKAGGVIEIKKYCYNSDLSANEIITSSRNGVIAGGILKAFSKIHVYTLGAKGVKGMIAAVGVSAELEERGNKIKTEISQLTESLVKITDVLTKLDLSNPAVQNNPKVKKLLETGSLLKRKLPLLKTKLDDINNKSICSNPSIIVEGVVFTGVTIQFFDKKLELRQDMLKIEFYFNDKTSEIGFKPYVAPKIS